MRRVAALAVVLLAPLPVLAQTVVYVNANLTTGADDGSSWASAYRGPQALKRAMDLTPALSSSQLWVAQGRYTAAPPSGDRRAAFLMKSGVAVYGGFAGGETTLAQRSPTAYPVILTADLNGDDEDASHNDENSIHLIHAVSTDHTAILDGLTIRDGYAWGLIAGFAVEDIYAANLLIENSDAAFINCTISDSFASEGAGVHVGDNANPAFTDCLITRNTAQDLGGGVSIGANSAPTFTRCDFVANRGGAGAGVFNGLFFAGSQPSSPLFQDCRFIDNLGDIGAGPGVGVYDASTAFFLGCEFRHNRTGAGGGGLFCAGPATTAVSCSFTGNEGTGDGGDALRAEGGAHRFTDCAFFAQGGPASQASGATIFVVGADTRFTNCTFANNNLGRPTAKGDSVFFAGGPGSQLAIDNCIFWNNHNQAGFDESAALQVLPGGSFVVNRSLVQGWTGSIPGTASFAADPLFADIDGPDSVAGTPDDDLRLSPTSPAIDSADNAPLLAALPVGMLTDPAGAPRFTDDPSTIDTGLGTPPIADRGAYEFQPICAADLNGDGFVDFSDYLVFLNYFDAADPRADFNMDGLIDFSDYLEFLNRFDAGC